jgi:hypothetical protein
MRCSLIVHSSLCLVPVMRLSEPTMNSCLPEASPRSVKNDRLTGRTSKHSAIREGPDHVGQIEVGFRQQKDDPESNEL